MNINLSQLNKSYNNNSKFLYIEKSIFKISLKNEKSI